MSRAVAIVGSGPSGCYLAQALLKAAPQLRIDILDRLPVPYGLVRYGVAADHQGTKAVVRQFERLFERQGAGFVGNVTVGEDVAFCDLRQAYDAVVLAAGLSGDRSLDIPGEELDGVYRAGRLTRALYEHPDADPLPELGPNVVIMGNGNVAIDLLRLLAKEPAEFAGSDLGAGPSAWLAGSGIETIDIVGRSRAADAKFDAVMIKELAKLEGVTIEVVGAGDSDDEEGARKIAVLQALQGHATGARRITFRFALTPVRLQGQGGRVNEAIFRGVDGDAVSLKCSAFVTAIGFQAAAGLPRDALVGSAVEPERGVLAPGLYATGWFRRGPRGTIPDNRADAQLLAARILADLETLEPAPRKPGREAFPEWRDAVCYAGWKRIDAAETASPPEGRCRAKVTLREAMLALACPREEPDL